MKNSQKGFTLIELMVVISIIGMLSSVVIASLQTARDKGRVAGGLKFATYNDRFVGINALVKYDFNDSTNVFKDISGDGQNSTCLTPGLCIYSSVSTPTGSGGSLAMTPGLGGVLMIPMGAGAGFNLLGSNDFTLSMWLRPTAVLASTDTLIVRPFNPGIGSYNYPVMSISSSRIVFGLGSPSAIEAGSIYVNSPPLNKWTQITQTYSSSKGLITGYVDGKQVVSYTPGLGTTLGQRMQIQFGGFISGQYTGAVDDFVFYGQALTAAEIQHIYAQSAQEHGIALTEIE